MLLHCSGLNLLQNFACCVLYCAVLWCAVTVIPARQPHLLDSDGAINRQLLERGSNPLVFTSLVLKTALGSYIQVRPGGCLWHP